MPNYDVNVRRDWFLPLVGGAELNRIKGPKPIIFTSRPYPVEAEDFATTDTRVLKSFDVNALDTVGTAVASLEAVTLRAIFQEYKNREPEELTTQAVAVLAAELRTQFQGYGRWAPEPVTSATPTVVSASLKSGLIVYSRWPPETTQTTVVAITAATLT